MFGSAQLLFGVHSDAPYTGNDIFLNTKMSRRGHHSPQRAKLLNLTLHISFDSAPDFPSAVIYLVRRHWTRLIGRSIRRLS